MCRRGERYAPLLQVLHNRRVVGNLFQCGAGHLRATFGAGGVALGHGALAYFAEIGAEIGLHAVGAAAHAVDGFGGDERFVV